MVQKLLNGPLSKKEAAVFEKAVVRIETEAVDEEADFDLVVLRSKYTYTKADTTSSGRALRLRITHPPK